MRKSNKIIFVIIAILLIIYFVSIFPNKMALLKVTVGIEKIGIIPVLFNENNESIKEDEIVIEDKQIINKAVHIINHGKINRKIELDRQRADYELYFYYRNNNVRKAYYWINCSKYNLNIEGIRGEITVDELLDKIVQ